MAEAAEVFEAHGVDDGCEAVVCDFFEAVPEGGRGSATSVWSVGRVRSSWWQRDFEQPVRRRQVAPLVPSCRTSFLVWDG